MTYPSVTGQAFKLTDPTLIGQNAAVLEGAMATGLSNGQFVVVYRAVSTDKYGRTTDFGPLMGQLLNADGSRVGDQFQVLADDAVAHPNPGPGVDPPLQVEALPDGGFVVQWQKFVDGVPHLQRFDSSGQKVGDEWSGEDWVTETEDKIYYDSQMMAVLPSGEIIMTFREINNTDYTNSLRILQFSADLSTVEAREQEFPDGARFRQSLDIDVLSDGRILMLFKYFDPSTVHLETGARFLDTDGSFDGDLVTLPRQTFEVAAGDDGGFMGFEETSRTYDIFDLQRFDAAGNPVGEPNTAPFSDMNVRSATITSMPGGGYLIFPEDLYWDQKPIGNTSGEEVFFADAAGEFGDVPYRLTSSATYALGADGRVLAVFGGTKVDGRNQFYEDGIYGLFYDFPDEGLNLSKGRRADLIIGSSFADIIKVNGGEDTVYGMVGDDKIFGGAGADLLYGNDGDDRIDGGPGKDEIFGGAGNDTIWAEKGNRHPANFMGKDILHGGDGDDVLNGSARGDRLYGDAGNDTIYGGKGSDSIEGGSGDDRIFGGDGKADNILGGEGDDTIFGQGGYDFIRGGEGNDTIFGQGGSDYLSGEEGDDRLFGGAGRDTFHGGEGNDLLRGGAGDDLLRASTGDDTLIGESGNDELYGEKGDDRLKGGAGSDRLYGGDGADTFIYTRVSDSPYKENAFDVIFGFNPDEDKIDVPDHWRISFSRDKGWTFVYFDVRGNSDPEATIALKGNIDVSSDMFL